MKSTEPLAQAIETLGAILAERGLQFELVVIGGGCLMLLGTDLKQLSPTRDEPVVSARWARSHDPSPAFKENLEAALEALGVQDAEL